MIAVAIFVLPFVVPSPYVIGVMCLIAIYGALALGKALLLEHAGVFSLAHPAWFVIGAYTTGIAAVKGAPPLLAILIAAALVGLIAYVISAPLLRLKGIYLICATFCLIIILDIAVVNMGSITGGHDGLTNVPPLSMAGFIIKGDVSFYLLSWALCVGTLWFFNNLLQSREGRAMRASRDSEAAAMSMGVNIPQYKLKIFVITAVMASLTGSILCFWLRYMTVDLGGFPLMVELITMIIIGGGQKLYGPLLGAFVVMWLREFIDAYIAKLLPRMTAEVDALFFGVIIVLILMFMPGGLTGWVEQLKGAIKRAYMEGKVRERLSR
jgi:branched-chain amino acid transport system permease protein